MEEGKIAILKKSSYKSLIQQHRYSKRDCEKQTENTV